MRKIVNLQKGIHKKATVRGITTYIDIGYQIMQATSKDELSNIVLDKLSPTWLIIDKKQYNRIDDFETLKNRILVHVIGKRINQIINQERSVPGPKSDRIKKFFDELTTEPMDVDYVIERYNLASNTIKNHRRYDLFPERGLTKIKKQQIFRAQNIIT